MSAEFVYIAGFFTAFKQKHDIYTTDDKSTTNSIYRQHKCSERSLVFFFLLRIKHAMQIRACVYTMNINECVSL